MNTQTHVLLAAVLLAKPDRRPRNIAVVAGALVPDLAIYTLFVWSKIAGIPEWRVWTELYFAPPWSDAVTVGNSAPLYLALLLVGLAIAARWRIGVLIAFFAGAALIHVASDLPVHAADAHAHLWPFSDWRFRSPVSYWDPNHNGDVFAIAEAVFGVVLSVVLWRRFNATWVRVLLALATVAYLAPPLYFGLIAGF